MCLFSSEKKGVEWGGERVGGRAEERETTIRVYV